MSEIERSLYPIEHLSDDDDDGTMPENVKELTSHVVGKKIVRAEMRDSLEGAWSGQKKRGLVLTLNDGREVQLVDSDDCCAFTEIEDFVLNIDKIDHVITGVGTTGNYTTWHIYADFGDVMQMKVGWSCGNPFYYAYGFTIRVVDNLKDVTVRTKEIES